MDLAKLIQRQYDLQVNSFGLDPLELEGEARIEYLRWNALALTDELHELLQATQWKPWATGTTVDEDEALAEFTDLLHFVINVLLVISPRRSDPIGIASDLEDRYLKKREVNAERQANGYDGRTGKCDMCHRDLAEITPIVINEPGVRLTACLCGHVLTRESLT